MSSSDFRLIQMTAFAALGVALLQCPAGVGAMSAASPATLSTSVSRS